MQLVDELQGSLEEYNFAIMITTDEEASQGYGHSGVAHLIKAGYRPGICLLPDSAAPGWDVEKLAKGWWRFDLIAKGKAAHGARPWEGESASIKLIHALHELKEHFKDHGPLTDSLNIGSIHGDGIYNQVPAHMMAKVEIRLADEAAAEKNKRLIETLCADHDITHNTYSLVQPVRAILDVPLAQTYMDVVQEITGRRPQGTISLAGSDAPYFTEAHIPCILSCPQGGGHHSEHEWLDKQSFLQFVPIVREFLERTARTAAASVDTAAQNGVK
jgi:acetylornithine deacetylase/succinyl-diaminopimelate desuccinylase-like protein